MRVARLLLQAGMPACCPAHLALHGAAAHVPLVTWSLASGVCGGTGPESAAACQAPQRQHKVDSSAELPLDQKPDFPAELKEALQRAPLIKCVRAGRDRHRVPRG